MWAWANPGCPGLWQSRQSEGGGLRRSDLDSFDACGSWHSRQFRSTGTCRWVADACGSWQETQCPSAAGLCALTAPAGIIVPWQVAQMASGDVASILPWSAAWGEWQLTH